ncbi:hypothetical protein FRB94_012170 [Tulasnella sp. JGI-2019a]|nr:hypothetical protein FRB94_012170 [Tulasnella sp. JGI-2019a]KAG9012724.1 hypothetical protein FRB93_001277 [Tulasnella sp. JGI-2019a]KAG9030485.1 hypothetical protein FRB95_003880 [Tulasnella sp. JGI-2019a]
MACIIADIINTTSETSRILMKDPSGIMKSILMMRLTSPTCTTTRTVTITARLILERFPMLSAASPVSHSKMVVATNSATPQECGSRKLNMGAIAVEGIPETIAHVNESSSNVMPG